MNALRKPSRRWKISAAALALFFSSAVSQADDVRMPVTQLDSYMQECSSCHMAYPPGLLPAESWRQIMDSLDRHYGTDASMDAQTAREISQWLRANSASFKRVR